MNTDKDNTFLDKVQSGYFWGQSPEDKAKEPYSSFYDIISSESRKDKGLEKKTLDELSKDAIFWNKCHDILKENQLAISRKRQELRTQRQPELLKSLSEYFPRIPQDNILEFLEKARSLIRVGY